MKRVDNKVFLAFGGASGMARATSLKYAEEGAKVVIVDMSEDGSKKIVSEIKAAGGEASYFICNVTIESEVEKAIAFAAETYGKLDIMLYQPGINAVCPLLNLATEDWLRVIQLNLTSAWWSIKYAAKKMQETGGGSIIITSSLNSTVPYSYYGAYCTTKAGVDMLVRVASMELGPNIRVNTINPSFMNTPQIAPFTQNPEIMDIVRKNHSAARCGEPEEFAYLALYLGSDESSFTTGSNVIIDGGGRNYGYPNILPPYLKWKKEQAAKAASENK